MSTGTMGVKQGSQGMDQSGLARVQCDIEEYVADCNCSIYCAMSIKWKDDVSE